VCVCVSVCVLKTHTPVFSTCQLGICSVLCVSVPVCARIKWLPSFLQGHVRVCEQQSDAFDPIAREMEGGREGGGRTGVRQAGGWADGPWKCY